MHCQRLFGQVIQTSCKPLEIVSDSTGNLRRYEPCRRADKPGRALLFDRIIKLCGYVKAKRSINAHQMTAEKEVELVAVRRDVVISIPPEPVTPLSGEKIPADTCNSPVFNGIKIGNAGRKERCQLRTRLDRRFTGLGDQLPGPVFFRMTDPDPVIRIDP